MSNPGPDNHTEGDERPRVDEVVRELVCALDELFQASREMRSDPPPDVLHRFLEAQTAARGALRNAGVDPDGR